MLCPLTESIKAATIKKSKFQRARTAMARKVFFSKDSDHSDRVPRRDAARGDNDSLSSADRPESTGDVTQQALDGSSRADSKLEVLAYAVPFLNHKMPPGMVPPADGHPVQCEPRSTMETRPQVVARDVTDGIHPGSSAESGAARGADQLDSAGAHAISLDERLIWMAAASEMIHGALSQVWSRVSYGLPVAGDTTKRRVPWDRSQESCASSYNPELLMSTVHRCSIGIGENSQDSRESHRNQDHLRGFESSTRASRQNGHDLVNTACSDLEAAFRLAVSLEVGIQSDFASLSPLRPSSRTWTPHNLASRVSRVQYYSKTYAEEVFSGPLEVGGYTVRLSVRCAMDAGRVSLSFSLQFCASASNERVVWPFKGVLQLTVHHPTDPDRSRRHRVSPSRPDATIMPRNADNVPLHLAGPITAMALHQEGLWAMRTLHLSISVSS